MLRLSAYRDAVVLISAFVVYSVWNLPENDHRITHQRSGGDICFFQIRHSWGWLELNIKHALLIFSDIQTIPWWNVVFSLGGVPVSDVFSGVRPACWFGGEGWSVHYRAAGLCCLPQPDHWCHAQHIHAGLSPMQVRHPCRSDIQVGQTSMQVRHPCRIIIHTGQASMEVSHPCKSGIHVGQTSIKVSAGHSPMQVSHQCRSVTHAGKTPVHVSHPCRSGIPPGQTPIQVRHLCRSVTDAGQGSIQVSYPCRSDVHGCQSPMQDRHPCWSVVRAGQISLQAILRISNPGNHCLRMPNPDDRQAMKNLAV